MFDLKDRSISKGISKLLVNNFVKEDAEYSAEIVQNAWN